MNTNSGAQDFGDTPKWSEQERMTRAAGVKPAREALGLTQQQVADAAGLARGTVAGMESGRVPQAANLARVLKVLDAHPDQQRTWPSDVTTWLEALAPLIDRLEDSERARVMSHVVRVIGQELGRNRPITLGNDEDL